MIKNIFLLAATVTTSVAIVGCAPNTLSQAGDDDQPGHPVARATYDCDGQDTLTVRYPDNQTALVPYQNQTHDLTIAVAADGARYADDEIVWWIQGSGKDAEATLFHAADEQATGDKITSCTQIDSSRMYNDQ